MMGYHRSWFVLSVCTLIVSGCTTPLSISGKGVRDATASMVSNCEFIGNFTATDMAGGTLEQRLENVKIKVKNQAGKAGANYVVYGSTTSGGRFGNEPILAGDAYKCKE